MQFKIPLIVDGLDLDDDATLSTLAEELSDIMWSRECGRTIATVFVADQHPVMRAADAALRIRNIFPRACAHRIDRDIVGVAEIADRTGVTAEAVRLWSIGKRGPGYFPSPIGGTGGGKKGPSKLWYWSDVNAWVDAHYQLGDGYRYLSERQRAMLLERLTSIGQDRTIVTMKAPQPVFAHAPSDLINVLLKTELTWTSVKFAEAHD